MSACFLALGLIQRPSDPSSCARGRSHRREQTEGIAPGNDHARDCFEGLRTAHHLQAPEAAERGREEVAPDDHALDLRRALVDLQQLRVAHQLLDRVLLGVAVAAEDLHRVGGDLHRRVGAERLRIGRLDRVELAPAPDAPRRLDHEQARRFVLHRHLGEHELDRLELADRLPERLALERVLRALLERAPHDSGRACRDPRARAIERLHRDLEALALLADQVRLRQLDVLIDDVAGVRGALAHLVFLAADRDARQIARDDETGDPLVPILDVSGPREGGVPARLAAVGDPALLAVQDVVVADLANGGAHARDVRARVRLAAGISREAALRGELPEIFLLLLFVAGEDQRHRGEVVAG